MVQVYFQLLLADFNLVLEIGLFLLSVEHFGYYLYFHPIKTSFSIDALLIPIHFVSAIVI